MRYLVSIIHIHSPPKESWLLDQRAKYEGKSAFGYGRNRGVGALGILALVPIDILKFPQFERKESNAQRGSTPGAYYRRWPVVDVHYLGGENPGLGSETGET